MTLSALRGSGEPGYAGCLAGCLGLVGRWGMGLETMSGHWASDTELGAVSGMQSARHSQVG